MKVLAIVPAHNEENSVAQVIGELHQLHPRIDVLVVDDASSDGTARVARSAGAVVITLPVNLGIGGAVQTGFKYATERGYDATVQVDGDGQHDPAELARILDPLRAGDADVVIGSRFLTPTGYRAPWTRRLGMVLFSAVARLAMGMRITDTTSGFRALDRRVTAYLARHYPVDFPDAETLVLLRRAGFRLQEVSVRMRPRQSGRSTTTTLKSFYYPFKQLLSIVVVLLRDAPAPPEPAPVAADPRSRAVAE